MVAPLGPFAYPAVGVALAIPVPVGPYTRLVIDNGGPYACQINIAGPQHWLGAFASDVYPVAAGATVTVTPAIALASYSGNSYITATAYRDDETILASYPTLLAITGSVTGTVSITAPPGGLPVSGTVGVSAVAATVNTLSQQQLIASGPFTNNVVQGPYAVPAWCRKIVLMASSASAVEIATVIGTSTGAGAGINWAANTASTRVLLAGSLYGSVDTAVSLQIGTAAANGTFYLVAIEEDDVYGSGAFASSFVLGQNQQVTNYEYCDGVLDLGATVTLAATGSATLIAAPPAGFLTRISGVSYQSTTVAAICWLATAGAAVRAMQTSLPATSSAWLPGPLVVSTAVGFNISGTSNTVAYAVYKYVPILR